MHVFIELWKCRPAWLEMASAQRAGYMESIQPAIGAMMGEGVECLCSGEADHSGDADAGFDFWAVWSMPSDEVRVAFADAIRASGWYDYFDQVNVAGPSVPLEGLIGMLVALPVAAGAGA